MSTRKRRQHYIPRSFLKRFASRVSGRKAWVWQFSVSRPPKEISTRDAAVASDFYGPSASGLEDALEGNEARLSELLWEIDAGADPQGLDDELRPLIWGLLMRTRALREQFGELGDTLLATIGASVGGLSAQHNLQERIFAELDRIAVLGVEGVPPAYNAALRAFVKTPEGRERAAKQVVDLLENGEFAALADRFTAATQPLLPEATRRGHIQAMRKSVSTDGSVPHTAFDAGEWFAEDVDHELLLSDVVGLVASKRGRFGVPARFVDGWPFLFVPIGPRRLLIHSKIEPPFDLDLANLNIVGARLARRVFFGATDAPVFSTLGSLVGADSKLMSKAEIDETLGDLWAEPDAAETAEP